MKELRSEDEIMATWNKEYESPIVSISCITYNQEMYIEDTIKGFLNQRTKFPFEVLIHDDASVDSTADIIRSYEKKYPRIIKPIYQKENQYSQKICINSRFNFSRAKGEYIAMCEGDDYWISTTKLQEQFDFMQNNLSCSFCCHNAYIHYHGNKVVKLFNKKLNSGYYNTQDLFFREWFIPTASLFIRKGAVKNLPSWIGSVRSIDLLIEIIASTTGKLWYSSEPKSIYRKNAIGSISSLDEKPWLFLEYRIVMMRKLFLYLSIRYRLLVVFDIFRSKLKIIYSKIKSGINK